MALRRLALLFDKDVAMEYSLIAQLADSLNLGWTSLRTGAEALVVDPSGMVIPEEPSTLKLVFAGVVTLSVYALVTGYRRTRRESSEPRGMQNAVQAPRTTDSAQRKAA
jgi:hypothetical protein